MGNYIEVLEIFGVGDGVEHLVDHLVILLPIDLFQLLLNLTYLNGLILLQSAYNK
jgi:hypothetical protein